MIVLTPDGMRALQKAAPLQVASVREHLIDVLTEQELATLTAIAERVVDRLNDPVPPIALRNPQRPSGDDAGAGPRGGGPPTSQAWT